MGFFRDLLFGKPAEPKTPAPPPSPFRIENGVLRKYSGPGGHVVIPAGVKEIYYAFTRNASVTHVTIPEGVTKIDRMSFCMCENLQSVTLPSTLKSIGPDAFGSCKNLRSIVIPESVVEIGNGAFSSCISLSEIVLPKGLTILGYNALRQTAIQRIEIPAGITKIDSQTFDECRKLTEVTFASGSTLQEIGGCAFGSCSRLKGISLPGNVRSIKYSAFENCISLLVIALPENIESIAADAFKGCVRLRLLVHHASKAVEIAEQNGWEYYVIDAPLTEEEQMMQAAIRELKKNGMLQ